ncbi:MAG: hypothetical protein IPG99_10485 [Ignavibacteria bacterium]|nr:hypothetical protein [Ignavibacteria bacterium]
MKSYKNVLLLTALLSISSYNCTKVENIVSPTNATPSAPKNLTVQSDRTLTTRSIITTLIWTSPATNGGSQIVQYLVYKGTSLNLLSILSYVNSNSLGFVDSTVFADSTYYYAVSARNEYGEGPISNVVNITPSSFNFYPSEPTNFACLFFGNSIQIDWNPPTLNGGSEILNYKLYKGSDSLNLSLFRTFAPSLNSYLDTLVNTQEQYYYQLSASNQFYEGLRTAIIHVSQQSQITFRIEGGGNPNSYTFSFTPSEDTRISMVIAAVPNLQFFDTLRNNNTNYVFSSDTTYSLDPYQGVQSGQAWTFKFVGNKVVNNESYIVVSNFVVP